MYFVDLKAQYKLIKPKINRALQRVLDKAHFILGEEVEKFEKEMAKFCGTKYAVGLNSGTDALFLSLKALNIGPGDEVITTPFTFIATAEVIANCGAKPVFIDIDPKTFNIDPQKLLNKLNKLKGLNQLSRLKAIIPVHLFGQMADMIEIMQIAKRYKLFVVEDAAQAMGALLKFPISNFQFSNKSQISKSKLKIKWRMAGTIGDIGCFSFFPSKNLGAYGDGGMITTNSEKLAEKIKLLRNHGSSPKEKYKNLILGVNSRLDEIQAAILRVKLRYIKKWNKKRAENAAYYTCQLSKLKHLSTPFTALGHTHIFHQYTVRTKYRDKLQKFLKESGIPTMAYYPLPLHLQPAFKALGYKKGDFPEAEKAAKEVLSLPVYPELTKKQQNYIIRKIREFYKIR